MKKLEGKNAIVTGASKGLGVHIARALAHEGVNLVLAARSADALEAVAEEMREVGVEAIAIPTDLAEPAQLQALAERAERALGAVDILINNAGVELAAPFGEYPPEHIELSVNVNLLATMQLTRAVLPNMLSRGRGHIVNMSSLAGKVGVPYQAPYSATKAAVVMFSHTLRSELMDEPVGVSVICPGFVTKAGMYARMEEKGTHAPKLLKPTTTAKVTGAVIRAIKRDRAELIVNSLPMRPLTMLRQLLPGIVPRLHTLTGVTRFARRISDQREADDPS